MEMHKILSIIILSICLLCSCKSEIRSRNPANFNHKCDIYKMLYFASLAGSSHNSQPWKVVVSGNSLISLYADTTRELPVVDPDRRELYISLGAFIENLTLGAGSLGYESYVKLNDKYQSSTLVAEIHLQKASSTGFDLQLIERRMTLRIPFNRKDINTSDLNQIISSAHHAILFCSSTSEEGCYIAHEAISAYMQQANNNKAKTELAKWIRFSDKDVKEKKDGLTTAGMQINGIGGFIVRHFYKPEDSKKASFIKAGIEKTEKQVCGCGGWIVISARSNSINEWVNLGRIYQNINLTCTKLNIGFQPMNQIVEEIKFKNEVTKHLGISEELMFIARIGYIDCSQVPVSPRRAVDDFAQFVQ
jgi:hypothetical protein